MDVAFGGVRVFAHPRMLPVLSRSSEFFLGRLVCASVKTQSSGAGRRRLNPWSRRPCARARPARGSSCCRAPSATTRSRPASSAHPAAQKRSLGCGILPKLNVQEERVWGGRGLIRTQGTHARDGVAAKVALTRREAVKRARERVVLAVRANEAQAVVRGALCAHGRKEDGVGLGTVGRSQKRKRRAVGAERHVQTWLMKS